MPVQSSHVNPGGGNGTWTGAGDLPGLRVLIAVFDRSGGVTASVTTNDAGWVTGDFVQRAERVTLPADGTHRRSAWLFESEIPAGIATNPIITPTVLDGSAAPVAHSWIIFAVDETEAAGFVLVDAAGAADSGTSTTTSQGTGSTGTAPAGDVLLIAVETTKGATTAGFALTDNTPGLFDLTSATGSGASQRRGSVGYAVLADQPSQTWSDTVTYGTARTSSALIVAFSTGSGGGTPSAVAGIGVDLGITATAAKTGAASAVADLDLDIAGAATKTGAAAATPGIEIAISGTVAKRASASATIPLNLSAAATVTKRGASAADLSLDLDAVGGDQKTGAASAGLALSLAVAALSGEPTLTAHADIGLTLGIAATAVKRAAASALLDLELGMSGAGMKRGVAAADLALALALAATTGGVVVVPPAIRVTVPADLIRATVETDEIRASVPASRIHVEVPE